MSSSTDTCALAWPDVCIVGPLPPPAGGMANQCEQLVRLLRDEGARVTLVRTNAPYRPAAVGRVPLLRAVFRLVPFLLALWRGVGGAQVVHLLANSGWSWHLIATPVLLFGRWRRVPVIVNYRGGLAEAFFARAPRHVLALLRGASLRVTPSRFLERVFGQFGMDATVIPNVVDLSRFAPRTTPAAFGDAPHLIVTRNLEPIYDIDTALRAFALIRQRFVRARLTVAGTGPELARLRSVAQALGVAGAVAFPGRIANAEIAQLYRSADCMLNPSTADNMPISILEALASGVPVVSTDAGGIPDLVTPGRTALLVGVGQAQQMADAAIRVLESPAQAAALRSAGLDEAKRYAWSEVRRQWHAAYAGAVAARGAA